ncbi:DUF3047 domain-containing protein [Halomonas aquatica]|uniref:DUF3047 domain-containing protein n=1 Tax=Halomonas aquatica TaxID=3151123 RepID=UPI003D80C525
MANVQAHGKVPGPDFTGLSSQASARQQASAKYLEREIDLRETPYLQWCWRVSATLRQSREQHRWPGPDERRRQCWRRCHGLAYAYGLLLDARFPFLPLSEIRRYSDASATRHTMSANRVSSSWAIDASSAPAPSM